MYNEIQRMIDDNAYAQGRAYPTNIIESDLYVLYVSNEGLKHIKDRHSDEYAPGSLFSPEVDFVDKLQKIISSPGEGPDERGVVKWIEFDTETTIGFMGVAHAEPSLVANMRDYIMPGGHMEKIKVAAGSRTPTQLINVITAQIGKLSDNRPVLSLITMYPGSNSINGIRMPYDRSAFASAGFYFVLPADSPMI